MEPWKILPKQIPSLPEGKNIFIIEVGEKNNKISLKENFQTVSEKIEKSV